MNMHRENKKQDRKKTEKKQVWQESYLPQKGKPLKFCFSDKKNPNNKQKKKSVN